MNKKITLSQLAMLYIVVWCISPPLSYGTIYRLIMFGAIGFLILKYILSYGFKVKKNYFLFASVVIYIIGLSIVMNDSITNRLSVIILFLILFCSESFMGIRGNPEEYFWIVIVTFVLCIIWNVCSLQGIAETPNVMRLLAKNSAVSEAYAMKGIGGFGYLYTVLLLLPIAIDCALKKKMNKIWRLIAVTFIVTTYILIFNAQYFLAIILSLFLLCVYGVMRLKNAWMKGIGMFVLMIIFIQVYLNADKVLLYLMEITDLRSIDLKLESIYDILVNGDGVENSEFSVRFERYMESFKCALSHPFVGGKVYALTGNHSHILDFFAQYGFIIGAIYLKCLFSPFDFFYGNKQAVSITCRLTFLIMLMLNTLAFSFSIAVYIILPLYGYQMEKS